MVKKERLLSCDQNILFCNIWVTSFCNFSCKYCYESVDKPEAYMNHETAEQETEATARELDREIADQEYELKSMRSDAR